MHSLIDEICQRGTVHDARGNEYPLHSHVDRLGLDFLFQLIRSNPNIRKTLEIGCAYGLSSLAICSALSETHSARHTIVDPCQHDYWHGVGIANLERAGLNLFEHIEEPSEFALPQLVRQGTGPYDLVFIDGVHTFDHTLLDLFYANRLIGVGGYIVVDDCNYSSVAKAVSYISKFPAYQLADESSPERTVKRKIANIIRTIMPQLLAGYILPRNLYDRYYVRTIFSRIVALKKVAEDKRNWDWFEAF